MTALDPKATFKVSPMNGRLAHVSGPSRLKQADWGWHLG